MRISTIKYISGRMQDLGIPYDFMEWKTKPPDDRYFVGEPLEVAMTTMEEDGHQDTTFILRGFTRGDWMLLMQDKETIEKHIPKTAILPDGTGIAVFYDAATVVSTGEPDLKSIKINLTIQEWRVN